MEDYNLSELQLNLINSDANTEEELPFSEKLRLDKQSLGIMALKLATLSLTKDRLYEMNENYELIWDRESFRKRLDHLRENYSKPLTDKIEYLIFDKGFYSFRDLPIFGNSARSSAVKRDSSNEKFLSKSRHRGGSAHKFSSLSPPRYESGEKEKSFHESRLSRIHEPSYLSSVLQLKN